MSMTDMYEFMKMYFFLLIAGLASGVFFGVVVDLIKSALHIFKLASK